MDGILIIRGREVRVSGQAWMDREWSSQPLASDQKGWDWFSLHLASGEKMMLFRLRSENGARFLPGLGSPPTERRRRSRAMISPSSRSQKSTWPAERFRQLGRSQVKSRGLDIETAPLNADSWMATSFPYWEGPISVTGSHQGVVILR